MRNVTVVRVRFWSAVSHHRVVWGAPSAVAPSAVVVHGPSAGRSTVATPVRRRWYKTPPGHSDLTDPEHRVSPSFNRPRLAALTGQRKSPTDSAHLLNGRCAPNPTVRLSVTVHKPEFSSTFRNETHRNAANRCSGCFFFRLFLFSDDPCVASVGS